MEHTQPSDRPSSLVAGYAGGEEMPLDGYATLLGAYVLLFGGALAAGRDRLPEALPTRDLLLTGVATHKLARILTRDWVTSPLRAPFTRYDKSLGSGEVSEQSRGRGLQRAVGDLLTCPWCIGPWVAGALAAGWVLAPRATRLVAATFSAVAVSDFLHQAYDVVQKKAKSA